MRDFEGLFLIKPGNTMSFGVTRVAKGVQFAIYLPDTGDCHLNLYIRGEKKPHLSIDLTKKYKWGSVYFVTLEKHPDNPDKRDITDILSNDYEYMYETAKGEFIDPYAAGISGRSTWGKSSKDKNTAVRGRICLREFAWEDDCQLKRPFDEVILYELHVRGFTRHSSSAVKAKGTFNGLVEKIPYLKNLGINAILLLPCYEFNEVISVTNSGVPESVRKDIEKINAISDKEENTTAIDEENKVKLNFWGYGAKETFYFAPKSSFANEKDIPSNEFKNMIKQFHMAGIEVLMDIYFSPGTNLCLMTDCLRHWVVEYHLDGFRVNDEVMPSIVMVSDPVLSGVKLLTSHWESDTLKNAGVVREVNALAEYNEGFMNDVRKYLKSDEGMVRPFLERFYRNPSEYSVINFITHVNGFNLMDLVSYDIKHNESNGENNSDGTDYNYSWNCGFEGYTRKKYILNRRLLQIRNALVMLFTSQGTPMIYAGDEFGNTQNGNNNPYCHDDNTTWVNWNKLKTNKEIFDFTQKIIEFRKEHPVFHQKKELMMIDTLSCGMPDLSVHGTGAWRPDYSNYNRMLGILLYGDYAVLDDGSHDDSVYIIFNMYWEAKSFDLPLLPEGKEWHVAVETYNNTFTEVPVVRKRKRKKPPFEISRKTIVPPRSVVIFVGR